MLQERRVREYCNSIAEYCKRVLQIIAKHCTRIAKYCTGIARVLQSTARVLHEYCKVLHEYCTRIARVLHEHCSSFAEVWHFHFMREWLSHNNTTHTRLSNSHRMTFARVLQSTARVLHGYCKVLHENCTSIAKYCTSIARVVAVLCNTARTRRHLLRAAALWVTCSSKHAKRSKMPQEWSPRSDFSIFGVLPGLGEKEI